MNILSSTFCAADLEDILKLLVVPESLLASSVLQIDCFHAAFSMQAVQPEQPSENSCQQPMAIDLLSEQEQAHAQPDLAGSEQNKHRPGTLTIQGMKQCQLLLSCMLRLTAHCLRRSPPLLVSSSFMETLPSICNLASHGGIQACLCARPVVSHLL